MKAGEQCIYAAQLSDWACSELHVVALRTNTKMLDNTAHMELNNVGSNKSSIYLALSFRKLCLATGGLPIISLLICFVTAYIFQQDDIHETHCRVSAKFHITYDNK